MTNGQGSQYIPEPSFETARARLLQVVRNKPEPEPQPDLFNWRRHNLRLVAQTHVRASGLPDAIIGLVLGVTRRTINNWRHARHAPTPRHYQQLRALCLLHRRQLHLIGK
jgi:hypothetical protein